jgi:hypothetical protein
MHSNRCNHFTAYIRYTHTTTTVPLSRAWKQCTVQKAQCRLAVPVPVLSGSTAQEVDPLVLTVLLTVHL